ncbi:uncharacterized protein N7487_012318 [Penicillium crustosum]|uniref:uncharacterized protein n=1 Tax=Penicillium crustosum TaxID=36656 RepID=UPI00238E09DB|nr:uncharacterized protein N7487_012318 [Penicillium crustosum]KAJ5394677.1 hypothetical protein N7487_012318 [Penicillium crustosum]
MHVKYRSNQKVSHAFSKIKTQYFQTHHRRRRIQAIEGHRQGTATIFKTDVATHTTSSPGKNKHTLDDEVNGQSQNVGPIDKSRYPGTEKSHPIHQNGYKDKPNK